MSEIVPDGPDADLERLAVARARTPARILAGRAGGSYRTATWLELRADHAAARDAVRDGVDLERDFGRAFLDRWDLFEVATLAASKDEYLLRPDLGRSLRDDAKAAVAARRPRGAGVQLVLGDGLSAAALVAQAPGLVPALADELAAVGMDLGLPFFVRHCRVGVMNDVGDVLAPAVVVLLIGERPGLATAESLSAYLAYRPGAGDDDSRRNLVSNIHARGVPIPQAAARVVHLARRMVEARAGGVAVKETWTPALGSGRPVDDRRRPDGAGFACLENPVASDPSPSRSRAMGTPTVADLTSRKCVPCEGGVPPLTPEEVGPMLKAVPGWSLSTDGKRIRREWTARNFVAGLDFFGKVGELAEAEGHHPDLSLTGYRHVAVEITTHAVGGLTENDFILAAKIDEIPIETKKKG